MSQFLGFDSFLIPLGATILDVHNAMKSALSSRGYQVVSENTGVTPMQLILIPPATELVGDSRMRDVLLLETGANYIQFRPVSQALQAFPQVVLLTPKTAGAASNAVTIGGVTVAQAPATVMAGNTAAQNLRYLFEALAASTDPTIAGFAWEYEFPAPQNADDGNPNIIGVAKTAVANLTVTPNANVNASTIGNYAAPGLQSSATWTLPFSVTTDLASGFVYYLQISARGIALATKTTSAVFGPIHACWGDHATAIASVPTANRYQQFLSPIELIVGQDNSNTNEDATGRVGKSWFMTSVNCGRTSSQHTGHPFGGAQLRHRFIDGNSYSSGYCLWTITIAGSSIWTNDNALGNDFQAHRISMSGNYIGLGDCSGASSTATAVIPAIKITDWYKFRGTATDESLLLVADTVQSATLAQALDATSDYSVITLDSTAALTPSGYVIVEGEAIQYTGISGATITGCARAKYGTTRMAHFSGAEAYQGLWFTKINGGLLFCGYNKPS